LDTSDVKKIELDKSFKFELNLSDEKHTIYINGIILF